MIETFYLFLCPEPMSIILHLRYGIPWAMQKYKCKFNVTVDILFGYVFSCWLIPCFSGTGTASIRVTDVNDRPPQFTKDEWITEVLETNGTTLPSEPILTVTVLDEDLYNDFYYKVAMSISKYVSGYQSLLTKFHRFKQPPIAGQKCGYVFCIFIISTRTIPAKGTALTFWKP